jgi:hypothetical protein
MQTPGSLRIIFLPARKDQMPAKYRIVRNSDGFTLIDQSGQERGYYGTRAEAEADLLQAEKEDAMWGRGATFSCVRDQSAHACVQD